MLKYISIVAVFLLATGIFSTSVSMSYAQNQALGQDGGGEAEQEIEQLQASKQDSQCVSGVATELSCNNIALQLQANGLEIPAVPEEPVAEEPVAEEPVAEEPVAEEPLPL